MHKIIIPELKLTEVCTHKKSEYEVNLIDGNTNKTVQYHTRSNLDFHFSIYNHFPIVLNDDGSPWDYAVLYLLDKLEAIKTPNHKTLNSIAGDLIKFKCFLDSENINYLNFPKRKMHRPTYYFRAYLQDQITLGLIARSTASRIINSVINFYKWLQLKPEIEFKHSPWEEKTFYLSTKNEKGFGYLKKISSTNLNVPIPNNQDDYSDCINDGGKLRPLSKEETKYLIAALKNTNNTEMILAFVLAITTGARIQTVFTLRLKCFEKKINAHEAIINIGGDTGVDTKRQKRMRLHIPIWLYNLIRVYITSTRAIKRREAIYESITPYDENYVFLTRSGRPYYFAENDRLKSNYRHPAAGESIRRFILKTLIPEINKMGGDFNFRFHDLRATFGMNLVEEKSKLIETGENTPLDVQMFVKERMGHNHLGTTLEYLDYRKSFKLALHVQTDFELHLESIVQAKIFE